MFPLELICNLHHLLSNLPWSLYVAQVVITTVILEEVAHLEAVVVFMVADRLLVIRGPSNVSIVGEITTCLRSAGRSLVALNGHNWLMLPAPGDTAYIQAPSAPHSGSSSSPTVVLS